ncbi:MAG: hypothetical protein JOY53_20065 [Acidobacteriaceae bacterium]|nr:hypothetical protein [Acidobacteriaceae bacterium]
MAFAIAVNVALCQETQNSSTQSSSSASQQPSQNPQQPGQLPPREQPGVQAPGKTPEGEDKRIFGVLPNYRTAEQRAEYEPISASRKMKIALKDSFDYPLMILAGAYAGLYQLEDSHPQFGQGLAGYARRLGTSYADQVNGNMLTEGIMPILLKEDPRYFRMAHGPKKRRTLYALSRIFVTHTDSGGTSFNYAEVIGNGMAAGIGLAYYTDNRNVPDFMLNWGTQLGTDATSQVLKEFWPDVKRWWLVRHGRLNPGNSQIP